MVMPTALAHAPFVTRECLRFLKNRSFKDVDILVVDIQSAQLTAQHKEKTHTIDGPDFISNKRKILIIARTLLGLKSLGAFFRVLLSEALHVMGHIPSFANGTIWIRPAIKKKKQMRCEHVLVHADNALSIGKNPKTTEKSMRSKFKLKGDKT